MLMMHQVVPHVHHEHEEVESSTQTIADHHHHGNEHQHSHDNKTQKNEADDEKEETNDFWGFLLGNHAHNYHSDFNQRVTKKNFKRVVNENDLPVYQSLTLPVLNYESPPPLLGKHPPNPNYHVYLSTQALRGPPSLG